MLAPSVNILWQGDRWTEDQKETFGPTFRHALDLAQIGLEGYGINFSGSKNAHLNRLRPGERTEIIQGNYIDKDNFAVHVLRAHLRQRSQAKFLMYFSTLGLHELVHCIRAELYKPDNLTEMAVTEGLADTIDSWMSKDYFGVTSPAYGAFEERGVVNMEDAHQRFLCDVANEGLSYQGGYEKWFKHTNNGRLVAMWSVFKQLFNGLEIADIMQMPAWQIMGAKNETAA